MVVGGGVGVVVVVVVVVAVGLVVGSHAVIAVEGHAEGIDGDRMAVSPKCQQRMNVYCNSGAENQACLDAMRSHDHPLPLYARFDTNAHHDPKEWRCYSSDALDANNSTYVSGTGYCTRQSQLLAVLAECESNRTTVDVFVPGELGYPCIRIPSIALVGDDTLLAFAECRNWTGDGCEPTGKHGTNRNRDICMKRSHDGGQTWSTLEVILRNAAQPTVVFDAVRYQTVLNYVQLSPSSNLQVVSHDHGHSWSKPQQLDQFLGPAAPSDVGPGVGIQLRSNASGHAGRLLFIGHHGAYKFDSVWYSDDGGVTYHLSNTSFTHMDEAQLVELPDGRVLANMRNKHINKCNCRGVSLSADGGSSFGPVTFDPVLISPVCMATIIQANNGQVYFANPASTSERANGVVRRSPDGRKWVSSKTVFPGAYAYSCLSLLPSHNSTHLGLLFETSMVEGCTGASCRTVFTTFSADF